jgi:hypothetical protein
MQAGGVDPQGITPQVYFSPGGAVLPAQSPNALAFSGSGILDSLVNGTNSSPSGNPNLSYSDTPGCGHDAACMWAGHQAEINNLINNNSVQSCANPTIFLPRGIKIPLSSFFLGGGSTGSYGGGWIFQPVYNGETGDFSGGGWLPTGGGSHPPKMSY